MSAFAQEQNAAYVSAPLSSVFVAEWRGGMNVYFKQLTPNELSIVKAITGENDSEYAMNLVILKALDENKERLFENKDADVLRHWPAQFVFNDIAVKMQSRATLKETKDFSSTTQTN